MPLAGNGTAYQRHLGVVRTATGCFAGRFPFKPSAEGTHVRDVYLVVVSFSDHSQRNRIISSSFVVSLLSMAVESIFDVDLIVLSVQNLTNLSDAWNLDFAVSPAKLPWPSES